MSLLLPRKTGDKENGTDGTFSDILTSDGPLSSCGCSHCSSIGKTKIRFQMAKASGQEFWARKWFVTISNRPKIAF
jgi:hypothetical protein